MTRGVNFSVHLKKGLPQTPTTTTDIMAISQASLLIVAVFVYIASCLTIPDLSSRGPSDIIQRSTNGKVNIAYFANWDIYGRNYQPNQIPLNRLTHIMYCFANIQSDGTVALSDTYADLQKHYGTDSWNDVGNNVYGNVKQLYLLKKQNRNLKVLLSIGGWTVSTFTLGVKFSGDVEIRIPMNGLASASFIQSNPQIGRLAVWRFESAIVF